jgi:hypothetical protein
MPGIDRSGKTNFKKRGEAITMIFLLHLYMYILSLSIESQVRIDKHHQKEVPGRVDAATPTQNTDTAPYDVVR